jgi:hypothetical protein
MIVVPRPEHITRIPSVAVCDNVRLLFPRIRGSYDFIITGTVTALEHEHVSEIDDGDVIEVEDDNLIREMER